MTVLHVSESLEQATSRTTKFVLIVQSFNLLIHGVCEPCTGSKLFVIPQMKGQSEVFGKQLPRKHHTFVHTSLF